MLHISFSGNTFQDLVYTSKICSIGKIEPEKSSVEEKTGDNRKPDEEVQNIRVIDDE